MLAYAQERNEALAQIGINKGSWIGPALLVIIAALLFVVPNIHGGYSQLLENLGIDPTVPVPRLPKNAGKDACSNPTLEKRLPEDLKGVLEAIGCNETAQQMLEAAWKNKDWGFALNKIAVPFAKVYFEQLAADFWIITKNALLLFGTLALCSLLPGLAGLIYRRNFWAWFLISFAVLYTINASGFLGVVRQTQPMPFSGEILFFLVFNLALLFVANRVRGYSSSVSAVPPWLHNSLLAAVLILVGVACFEGWGPSWIWSFLGSWIYKWEFLLIGLPVLYILFRTSNRWNDPAPKNIVVCLDGTSNTPDDSDLGLLAQTNVFKLFRMLKADGDKSFVPRALFDASLCKRYANRQIAFYYTGVGNKFDNDPILQTLGMAAGAGATGIVERAYLDVMRVYRPKDRIYIFGFSRGAAAARLLARAIDSRGAPRRLWTLRLLGHHWLVWRSSRKAHEVPIAVLGCWDTVGSFGIAKTIAGINFQQLNLFRDLSVPENVRQAYHLLALDEMRDSFEPTYMEPDPISPERIVEVWFSGDHCNVGGGWATEKLSDVTLDFMLRHVSSGYAWQDLMEPGDETWGLYLKAVNAEKVTKEKQAGALAIHPDPLGQLRSVASRLYKYAPRKLPLHAVISETVFERMTNALPVYAPPSLFNHNEDLAAKRHTIDTQLARLVETHSLLPEERDRVIEFKDKLRLARWPQYVEELKQLRAPPGPERTLANEAFANAPLI